MIPRWLQHPATRELDLDDPQTTERRRDIILGKPFLRDVYKEWYGAIEGSLPSGGGLVLEIGSGGGFLKQWLPEVLTSDILPLSGMDLVLDARALPFGDETLRAIAMLNTFHHIPEPRLFLREARRCLRPGGRLICVEPWNSAWSRLINRSLHHEPFEPEATAWEFNSSGPLGDANGALPWIVFERDRMVFEEEFPNFQIEVRRSPMPFRYLLSGGVSTWASAPGWSFEAWRCLEAIVARLTRAMDMFAVILLTRSV